MKKLTVSAFAVVMSLTAGAALAGGDWEAKFKQADTNGDGGLSMAEWNVESKAMFEKADANKDGKVTWAEKKALMDMKHDGFHHGNMMNNKPSDKMTGDEKIQDSTKKDMEMKSN